MYVIKKGYARLCSQQLIDKHYKDFDIHRYEIIEFQKLSNGRYDICIRHGHRYLDEDQGCTHQDCYYNKSIHILRNVINRVRKASESLCYTVSVTCESTKDIEQPKVSIEYRLSTILIERLLEEEPHSLDEIDFDADIDDYRDRIQTLEDLLRFPLTSAYKSCYRAECIYVDKVKEILGIKL